MNVFEVVKASVSVPDAAKMYGIQADRHSMAKCPLRYDRIHVANGTWYLDGHFSEDKEYCRNRLDVAYNPSANAPEVWLSFLKDLLEPEDIPTLQEYLGYCLIPSTKAQKMLMLIGKGGEGKSRIGLVMRSLNIITYSIVSTENEKLKASIREISTDFVDSFLHSDERIYFISPQMDQDQISPLKRTLKDPMFDRIFLKATDFTVAGLDNPSRACVFYIDPSNCKFRFSQMKEFIVNNIGSYVFSRAKVKRLVDRTKNPAAVGAQAMLKFIRTYGANAETVLGEILLYVFMEQELDAPKIMSKIEIDEFNRNAVSKSDGVHLLSLAKSGRPFHQLVFGASDIVGNLQVAIDRAFDKIVQIEANSDMELRMADNTTQWTIYDPDATKYMVELMTPQRNGTYKPDMAFGAFLGYTIKLDNPEPDSQKYRTAVKEQLKKDIADAQEYIIKKIQENGLGGYSFYFYTFPFNDASNEKVSIIKELLSGGGIV